MSKFSNAIGIDVSKMTLDAYDHLNQLHCKVSNNATGFKELLKWIKQHQPINSTLLCFEHTGIYSLPLATYLSELKISYALVPGLEIKRSLGISRGKTDKADAQAIARYAYLRREEITIYQLPSKQLLELKGLLSVREKMVTQRAGYQSTIKELKYMNIGKTSSLVIETQQHILNELKTQIQRIEREIKVLIEKDEKLKETFRLVTSVKGVGLIVGATMMVYTNCFTSFTDWRKFACYCGIVPFDYQSGISIKGRRKLHPLANKKLKSLLSNAACTSILHNPEMKIYYERRIKEGKDKMSTQNVIRNKIVARVFAAVNRGTPYVDTLKFAA